MAASANDLVNDLMMELDVSGMAFSRSRIVLSRDDMKSDINGLDSLGS